MSTVYIEKHAGRLRLRWFHANKRYTLAVGVDDDPTGRAVARQKAGQIDKDIAAGYFDPTLLKYRPQILGKNATVISCPELFERFMRTMEREKNLASGSMRRYVCILSHLRQCLDVSADTVRERLSGNFAAYLSERVSAVTAKSYLYTLSACWDWAIDKYRIAPENPWPAQIARIKPQPKQKVKPFTVAEVCAILGAFKTHPHYSHYADFVAFLFGCGTRFGEAVALRWEDVAADFSTVWIGRSITGRDRPRNLTKTGKARTVLVSSKVAEMLRERYEAMQPQQGDLVFPAQKGGHINDSLFRRRAWKSVLIALNIPYRKPYSTRHTAISHALKSGANYIELAEATGHDAKVLHQSYASAIESKSIFVEF
jgi:integrase